MGRPRRRPRKRERKRKKRKKRRRNKCIYCNNRLLIVSCQPNTRNEQQSHPPPSLFLSISSDIYQSISLPLTRGHGIECNPVGTPEKPKRRREDNSNRRPTNWPPTIRLCFVSVARFIFFLRRQNVRFADHSSSTVSLFAFHVHLLFSL